MNKLVFVMSIIGSTIAWASAANAQVAVSADDGHSVLINGVTTAVSGAAADNVAVIDLSKFPPSIKGIVDAPASVIGPAQCVYVSKDQSLAIVASASRLENGAIVSDDRVSVIDISSNPPKVIQQVHAGAGADCVAVTPDGSLAIIVNRTDGNLSVFSFKAKQLAPIGTVDLGNPKSTPGGIVITADGKAALVTRDDGFVTALNIDGDKVAVDKTLVLQFPHPYPIDLSPDGKLAAVVGSWGSNGDIGTVALIDLGVKPFRVVEVARVPSASEGVNFSPDGKFLAVSSINGSTRPPSSPLYNDHAVLTVFAVSQNSLSKVAEAPIGQWSQGVIFSPDGKMILAQNMVQKNFSVFRFLDGKLTAEAPLPVERGAPATIGTARP